MVLNGPISGENGKHRPEMFISWTPKTLTPKKNLYVFAVLPSARPHSRRRHTAAADTPPHAPEYLFTFFFFLL